MRCRRLILAVLPLALAGSAIAAMAAGPAGNAERGRQVFAQCAACHKVDTSGRHGIGPNLRGVVGRQAGSYPGFGYSAAMKNARRVWNARSLDAFLAAPATALPGNRMPFAGLRNPADRQDVIAYLRSTAR